MKGRKIKAGNHAGQTAGDDLRETEGGGQEPQRHGTDVAHDHSRRRAVDDQEWHGRRGQRDVCGSRRARQDGADAVSCETGDRHRRREAVTAVHEVIEVERPRDDRGGPEHDNHGLGPRGGEGSGHASAIANHSAAKAWTRSRTPTPSARASSRSETSARTSHGTSHGATAPSADGDAHTATGSHPNQIAMPPPRGSGAPCSERSFGTSWGSFARDRSRAHVASALTANANSAPPAVEISVMRRPR